MKKAICLLCAWLLIVSLSVAAAASETVARQIQELPSVEEYAAMDKEAQTDAYNRTQYAYDAYMALTETQRGEIEGAEEKFQALFTYFNQQIEALTPEGGSGKTGSNFPVWIVMAAMALILLGPELRKKRT